MATASEAEGTGQALPLVLLPGTLCDEAVFARVRARLGARGRDAVVLPLPEVESVDAAVPALLDGLPRRCALLGFSLGGIVALHAALAAPERIAALVLVASTARAVPVAEHRARRAAAVGEGADAAERWFAHRPADADAHRDTVRAMAARAGEGTLRRQTELALGRPDMRARLAALRQPVLVLGGTEDRTNPPAIQREIAAGAPDATLVLVPGAGHFLPLEAPDACAAAIESWLAAREPRIHPLIPETLP